MRSPEDIILKNRIDITLESNELLRLFNIAFNNSPDASAILDNGKIVLCNLAFNILFGWKSNENLSGIDFSDFISPTYRKDFYIKLKEYVKGNESSLSFESKGFKCNAKEFDVEIVIHSELVSGKVFLFLSVRDISEKKSLLDQIQKNSHVIENSSSMIILTNSEGLIEYTNTRFTEITGFYFEEVFGRKIKLILDEEVSDVKESEIWSLVQKGNSWRGEIKNKKKNGEQYWESVFISPIKDENGKINHFLILKDDLTYKKEIELELKRALDCAEEANKLKFNLLSNMSHELRTPLTGIIGFSSLLRDELIDTDHVQITDKILKSSKRLLITLNSVLNLAEIESGNYPISLTEFNLSTYTKYFLINYDKNAAEKNLTFDIEVIDDEIYAIGDENLFKQILVHITDNAIKFTNVGGVKVQVTSQEDEQGSPQAVIKVVDTGIGICNEDKTKIFREFRQLSEGIRRNFEGSGLGLSVAKKMIKLMKGDIFVESVLNHGSTFSIVLPGLRKNTFNSNLTITVKPDSELKNLTPIIKKRNSENTDTLPSILSIEDNFLNSELVNLFLRNLFIVDSANNYDEAMQRLRTCKYDAVLIDINLGKGPSGIDIAKDIRNMTGYELIPLIALTGYALLKDEKYLLSEGFNYYLHKPFDRGDLIKVLNKALKKNH
ncbi:MAG: PAS domain S-box protein [Bacteroidota bacterium]